MKSYKYAFKAVTIKIIPNKSIESSMLCDDSASFSQACALPVNSIIVHTR